MDLLHGHLAGSRPGRSRKRVHASDLTRSPEWCPREQALLDVLGGGPRDEWLGTCEVLSYDVSRAVQDLVTGYFADMGRAWGPWRCRHCRRVTHVGPPVSHCPECDRGLLAYREPRFRSAVSGISCGIDLLVDVGEPLLRAVEVKALKLDDYKAVVAPLAEHRDRTNLYLRILSESDSPHAERVDHDVASVLYVAKAGWGQHDRTLRGDKPFRPFKEFEVRRRDEDTQLYTDRARAYAITFREEGTMPEGVCPTSFCERAKACRVSAPCFSGDHPAGQRVQR